MKWVEEHWQWFVGHRRRSVAIMFLGIAVLAFTLVGIANGYLKKIGEAIPNPFARSALQSAGATGASSPEPAPLHEAKRPAATDAATDTRRYIGREKSAGEVLLTVKSAMQSEMLGRTELEVWEQLFKTRWIPEPGWKGTLDESPRRSGRMWDCVVREDGTSAAILVITQQDISELRKGDAVLVTGQCLTVTVRDNRIVVSDGAVHSVSDH
jgi:hypothetical protein